MSKASTPEAKHVRNLSCASSTKDDVTVEMLLAIEAANGILGREHFRNEGGMAPEVMDEFVFA